MTAQRYLPCVRCDLQPEAAFTVVHIARHADGRAAYCRSCLNAVPAPSRREARTALQFRRTYLLNRLEDGKLRYERRMERAMRYELRALNLVIDELL